MSLNHAPERPPLQRLPDRIPVAKNQFVF